jgi:hypothetical protein
MFGLSALFSNGRLHPGFCARVCEFGACIIGFRSQQLDSLNHGNAPASDTEGGSQGLESRAAYAW